jgi:hypothetical protein
MLMKSPQGLFVDVPDGTDPQELKSLGLVPHTAQSAAPEVQAAQAPRRTMSEDALRQLGLFGRMAVHGATQTSGALADAAVGGINKLTGAQMPMPTVAQEQMMNRFLPQPENDLERVVQGIGSTAAGAMFDPVMAGNARVAKDWLPMGYQDAAKNMISPETAARMEQMGSGLGASVGGYLGHRIGSYPGLAGGGLVGGALGKAGGEALAKRLLAARMPPSLATLMGNSPNMARFAASIPEQWLTPREQEQQQ